ncbi:MAG TPA: dienelactone hydrolase family protein, partial [Candidatus Binatia bacterium]|nr:dienelactone hydrolase family protein [Candidatus Binatia bacterium]
MSEVRTEQIELAVADGSAMSAYVARPKQDGPHPGMLLFQEAFGVNHHIRNVAERFAAEGYVGKQGRIVDDREIKA